MKRNSSYSRRKRVTLMLYIDPEQKAAVAKLSKTTRVPQAEYLREGVDMMLARYKKQLKGAGK